MFLYWMKTLSSALCMLFSDFENADADERAVKKGSGKDDTKYRMSSGITSTLDIR